MEQAGSHTLIGTGMHTTQMLNSSGRKLCLAKYYFNLLMAAASGILKAFGAQIILSTSTYGEK